MTDREDYYALLGVSPQATQADVAQAFAALVAASAADPQRVLQLTTAFQVLSNPEQRAAYDLSRAQAAPVQGPAVPIPTVSPAVPTGMPIPTAVPIPTAAPEITTAVPAPSPGLITAPPAIEPTVSVPAPIPGMVTEDSVTNPVGLPAPGPGPDSTVLVGPSWGAPAGEVTQRPASLTCPVCGANNPSVIDPSTTYCQDCGFLLGQTPGSGSAVDTSGVKLVSPDGVREFLLREGVNVVGRQDADVLLADATISRQHARLYLSGDQLTVEDANSTNGTKRNGVKVEVGTPVPVGDGDELQFGQIPLRVRGAGAPSPESAAPAAGRSATPRPEGSDPEVGRLIAASGGQVYPVYSFPATIGRRPDNAVVINDPYVSGRHAELVEENGVILLRDLGSTNGTIVGQQPVASGQAVPVTNGTALQLGKQRFKFETEAAAGELPTESPGADAGQDGGAGTEVGARTEDGAGTGSPLEPPADVTVMPETGRVEEAPMDEPVASRGGPSPSTRGPGPESALLADSRHLPTHVPVPGGEEPASESALPTNTGEPTDHE